MCKKKNNKNQNSNQGIWEVTSFDKLKQGFIIAMKEKNATK